MIFTFCKKGDGFGYNEDGLSILENY